MSYFVFSGKKKIRLNLKEYKDVDFLCNKRAFTESSDANLIRSMKAFFEKNGSHFLDKKVCVVIPDNTRDFHAKKVLKPLSRYLGRLSRNVEFIIALGLHIRLGKSELIELLGVDFIKSNKVIQHSLEEVKSLGQINGTPATLNRRLLSYDLLFTVGVVEPHLYAGFSGGIKGIGIGLAGRKTILHTHSVTYLSQKGVKVSNTRTNPFQKYLWDLYKNFEMPVYSLNIMNNLNKKIAYCSMGEARKSFSETVKHARAFYSYRVRQQYDLLFVGCDSPKESSLYQASRLFNAVLDKKALVKKGGAIFVTADLGGTRKSHAEKNFERIMKRKDRPPSYAFAKPGEHRAGKIFQASQMARLGLITPYIPRGRYTHLNFFKDYREGLAWARENLGEDLKIGIIPLGFSFIPS